MSASLSPSLELDLVQRMLAARCGSRAGRASLDALTPRSDLEGVRAALEQTTEARALLVFAGRQPYGTLPDLDETLAGARVRGARLEPRALREVAAFAADATEILRLVSRCADAPRLARRAGGVPGLADMASAIRRVVLPSGEIADDASPRLAEVRRAVAGARSRLHEVMTSYVQDRDSARLLQERIVSTRNDRYVLLLKAENRGQIPGIIHGASGSGASLFVEPLPAVELNNDIVALAEEERAEVARVLEDLTERVHGRLPDLDRAVATCAHLDACQAMALLAEDMSAHPPTVVPERRIDLRDARHPLLMADLTDPLGLPRRSRRDPVPVSIAAGPEDHILVISGPNTGGKTVALKSLGLLTAMAHCGLHVPAAAGSVVPLRRRIYADIGDEQSIVGDLSTFSAHLANIVTMLSDPGDDALILLDELGSGTDPAEGGALAVAIVDHFRSRGALAIVTTHHASLKEYALRTPGVASASFGYDPSTYAPTYRLQYGTSGRSLALEMAERLGVPPTLLAEARARMDPAERELAQMRREVEEERARARHERRALETERARLDRLLDSQRALVDELESRRRTEAERFRRELDRKTQIAFEKADAAIRAALRRLESSRGAALRSAATAREAAAAALAQARNESLATTTPPTEPVDPEQLLPGDRVRVASFGVTATVLGLHGVDAEVETGGKRLRVPVSGLQRAERRESRRAPSPFGVDGALQPPAEINVIGQTVDDALPRVDKALDTALLEDRSELRVIHGHGAGRLRRAVSAMLATHAHVATFRPGGEHEGGAGVTIVTLKGA